MKQAKNARKAVVAIGGIMVLAGLVVHATSARAGEIGPPILNGENCLDCTSNGCTVGGTHKVVEDVDWGNSEGSGHFYCSAIGSCLMGHQDHSWVGSCEAGGLEQPDLDLLTGAVEDSNSSVLRTLIASHPQTVLISRTRGTVQVVGCNGHISVQLPIGPTLLSDLGDR